MTITTSDELSNGDPVAWAIIFVAMALVGIAATKWIVYVADQKTLTQSVSEELRSKSLADYAPRPTQKVPQMTTTGALGKVKPAAVNTTREE